MMEAFVFLLVHASLEIGLFCVSFFCFIVCFTVGCRSAESPSNRAYELGLVKTDFGTVGSV